MQSLGQSIGGDFQRNIAETLHAAGALYAVSDVGGDLFLIYRSISTRNCPSALSLERSTTSNTPNPKPDPVT